MARFGSVELGSDRRSSARPGSTRLEARAHLGSPRPALARLGSARLGSVRLGSARFGSARLLEFSRKPDGRNFHVAAIICNRHNLSYSRQNMNEHPAIISRPDPKPKSLLICKLLLNTSKTASQQNASTSELMDTVCVLVFGGAGKLI